VCATTKSGDTAHGDWTGDRLAQLISGETGNQVLAVVDRFREAPEQRELAEEIRSHGEHDEDRHLA